MNCPKCQRELVDGNCPSCGATQAPVAAPTGPPPRARPPSAAATAAPGAAALGDAATEPSSKDALIGQVVGGRFRITSFIGEGAMGLVYRATQLGLARDVALKFLHRHLVDDGDRLARFEREALAMSKIEHPGIVAIYDYGRWNGQTYIAMQYLAGQSLEKLVKSSAPLPLPQTVRIVSEICDALDAAHAAGIVHRDLKPENVMLVGAQQHVRIVDFGIAKLADTVAKLTHEGSILGTPAYMSPEQCSGDPIGPQTDIYALGVMLFELLTGALPFKAPSAQALIFKHVLDEPSPPSTLAPGLHGALDEVTMWAMKKRREARPSSAGELKSRLQAALDQIEGRTSDQHRRKTASYAATRAERSAVIGAAPTPRKEAAPAEGTVIAVGKGAAGAADSPATHLKRAGYRVLRVERPADVTATDERAVVIDLGADAAAGLEALEPQLSAGKLAGLPVIVVGPDDAMDQMSRALELKLAAYVPRSKLQKRLAKVVRRASRRS